VTPVASDPWLHAPAPPFAHTSGVLAPAAALGSVPPVPLADDALLHLPLWRDPTPHPLPVEDLGLRALPLKCKARTFDVRLRRAHPSVWRVLLPWFRRTLRGEYPHVSPSLRTRLPSYEEHSDDVLKQWLLASPSLALLVVREHMFFLWVSTPGFVDEVARLLHWQTILDSTHEACNRLRVLVARTRNPEQLAEMGAAIFASTQDVIIPKAPMRWRAPFFEGLASAKPPDVRVTLTGAHDRALSRWILHLPGRLPWDAFETHLARVLAACGVPEVAIRGLRYVRRCHDHWDDGKRRMQKAMDAFVGTFPYAAMLTREACARWCVYRQVWVSPLSAAHAEHQATLLQKRYRLSDAGLFPEIACVWFCRACKSVRTLVNRVKRAHARDPRRSHCAGFADVMLDPFEDRYLCPHKRQNNKRCMAPVAHMPLMGFVARVFGKTVRFCDRCGFAAVDRGAHHPELPCRYDAQGFVCSLCTHTERAQRLAAWRKRVWARISQPTKCRFCAHRDRKGTTLFCVPMGFVVCAKHTNDAALADMQRARRRGMPLRRAERLLASHVSQATRRDMGLTAGPSAREKRFQRAQRSMQRWAGRQNARTRFYNRVYGT